MARLLAVTQSRALGCLQNTVVLYKVSDATGSLKVDKLAQKPLSQAELNTNVSTAGQQTARCRL